MPNIILSYNSNIAIVTFTRPEVMNALNTSVLTDLKNLLLQIEQNKNCKVLLLTGEGKAFVAGADIAQMKNFSANEALQFSELGHEVFNLIENFPIPVIGVINGFALGGGLELALACDFLLASDTAKFGAPEVNLGLIPGFCGTQRLARAVGFAYAKYLIYSASVIDAKEALARGLVQLISSPETLMDKAFEVANLIAGKSKNAVAASKTAINCGMKSGILEGVATEKKLFTTQFSLDAPEGITAFLEKRKPNWN